jgi:hypothetical protein
MFSLRNRFGIPGVISVIALVFAMTGGAYAAKKYVITSPKQIKPTVLKTLKGKRGPRGPAGVAGTAGPQGPAGAPGAKGDKGDTGAQGPQGGQGPQGNPGPQGVAGPAGPAGDPWTVGGTLPPGETETGTWGGQSLEGGLFAFPISFTLPLTDPPTPVYVSGESAAGCPGIIGGIPTAEPGKLCVYAGRVEDAGIPSFLDPENSEAAEGASRSGTLAGVFCEEFCAIYGVWAVTAPVE